MTSEQSGPVGVARRVARILLQRRAVAINAARPFVYASGITSPIYTDNRLLISYPEEREQIVEAFVERMVELLGPEGVDAVAGTATAGIPWAAWVAGRLRRPLVYVRPGAKEHGRGRQIEGVLEAGQRVAVIEDLITTGGSSLQTVEALRQAGAVVTDTLSIFTYEFDEARQAYEQAGVRLTPLSGISVLLEVATAEGHIGPADREAVLRWQAPHRAGSGAP